MSATGGVILASFAFLAGWLVGRRAERRSGGAGAGA